MATITINGVDYWSYQTVAEVDAYAAASIGEAADAWAAADPTTTQPKAAVSATRLIDQQQWVGAKTDPDQPGAFPRTGLTLPDGTPVDPDSVPIQVLSAHSELSMALCLDATTGTNTTAETRRLKAGSVEIEYFRGLPADRFPLTMMDLIGFWLGGRGVLGSESTGTCGESAFSPERYNLTRGF